VLGERDAAREALRSGLTAFQGDAAAQQRLRAAASELGVPAA
jgi:cytochrome c-type biogenesis protein CcmH